MKLRNKGYAISEQKACVTVKREHSFYSCAVIFGVYIDGAKVGSVVNGGESTFEVEPGKHSLECKESLMGRLIADGAPFEIQAGEHLEFCLRRSGFVLTTFWGMISLSRLSSGFGKRYFKRFTLAMKKR